MALGSPDAQSAADRVAAESQLETAFHLLYPLGTLTDSLLGGMGKRHKTTIVYHDGVEVVDRTPLTDDEGFTRINYDQPI